MAVLRLVLFKTELSGKITAVGPTMKKLMKIEARTVVTMMKIIKVALA